MRQIVFSKMLREKTIPELIALAHEHGYAGYDLCVRPGYPVNPENAHTALVAAQRDMQGEGLAIAMVTGNFDLLTVDHPTARPILAAMDQAGVRLLKLGYFRFDAHKQDYAQEVVRVRRALDGWEQLAQEYNVKICYHTHSGDFMGLNCSALLHLIDGFDPHYVGAYIDPGHLAVNGEDFPIAVAMVRKYLSIVAVKDVLVTRDEKNGHGAAKRHWVRAGEGLVDWTEVFGELQRVGFDGPVSVHCEFELPAEEFGQAFAHEVAFFRRQMAMLAAA